MPFNLGPAEVIIILVIVLIVFGVGRLPEVGGALGKGIREFRRAQAGLDELVEPREEEAKASEKEE
ncbi:MAG: twin-arginine translocase TatA/TatE family subunit [Anaerolineae bacterium]